MSVITNHFPAWSLTANNEAETEELWQWLIEKKLTKEYKLSEKQPENGALFEQGSKAAKILSQVFSVDDLFNAHFYLALAKTSSLTVGLAPTGEASFFNRTVERKMQTLLTEIQATYPSVTISDQIPATDFPKDSVLHPTGFRKHLGFGQWFMWS